MKQTGFTLVELMGVILLLAVIALLVTPIVDTVIKKSRDQLYNSQIENIKSGLKDWAIDNPTLLPQNHGDKKMVLLGTLKSGGYVDKKIENPKTKLLFKDSNELFIVNVDGAYRYDINNPE